MKIVMQFLVFKREIKISINEKNPNKELAIWPFELMELTSTFGGP